MPQRESKTGRRQLHSEEERYSGVQAARAPGATLGYQEAPTPSPHPWATRSLPKVPSETLSFPCYPPSPVVGTGRGIPPPQIDLLPWNRVWGVRVSLRFPHPIHQLLLIQAAWSKAGGQRQPLLVPHPEPLRRNWRSKLLGILSAAEPDARLCLGRVGSPPERSQILFLATWFGQVPS